MSTLSRFRRTLLPVHLINIRRYCFGIAKTHAVQSPGFLRNFEEPESGASTLNIVLSLRQWHGIFHLSVISALDPLCFLASFIHSSGLPVRDQRPRTLRSTPHTACRTTCVLSYDMSIGGKGSAIAVCIVYNLSVDLWERESCFVA